MISERESRIRLVEDCKYLISRIPFGTYNLTHIEIQLTIIRRKRSDWTKGWFKEIQINKEPLDNHVLLSMFTTPELIELKVTLARYVKLEKEMI